MKFLFIVILLTLQFQIYSQTKSLNSFMDIKWGSSTSAVIDKMTQKENVEIVKKTDTLVVMRGGNFAGREVWTWQFYFWQNQFYSVTTFLSVPTPIYLDDMFYTLQRDISNRYGNPSAYDSTSYASRKIFWEFDKSDEQTDKCFIILTINSDPFFWIVLVFQNSSIFDKIFEHESKKRKEALNEL